MSLPIVQLDMLVQLDICVPCAYYYLGAWQVPELFCRPVGYVLLAVLLPGSTGSPRWSRGGNLPKPRRRDCE